MTSSISEDIRLSIKARLSEVGALTLDNTEIERAFLDVEDGFKLIAFAKELRDAGMTLDDVYRLYPSQIQTISDSGSDETQGNNSETKAEKTATPVFVGTKFYGQLAQLGAGVDISIRIKEKNGTFTVSVEPQVANQARIKPLLALGTPDELDEGFFPKMGPIIRDTVMKILNADEHSKSVQEAVVKNTEKGKTASPPAASNSGKADKKGKTASKKSAPKKEAKKTEKPAEEETPKVQEQSLF